MYVKLVEWYGNAVCVKAFLCLFEKFVSYLPVSIGRYPYTHDKDYSACTMLADSHKRLVRLVYYPWLIIEHFSKNSHCLVVVVICGILLIFDNFVLKLVGFLEKQDTVLDKLAIDPLVA